MKRSGNGSAALVVGVATGLVLCAWTPASADGVYFVKSGDSLGKISRVFNVEESRLREVNGLTGTSIRPGDRIRIPERALHSTFVSTRGADPSATPDAPTAPVAPVAAAARTAGGGVEFVCKSERQVHVVSKGDTLSAISRRYGTTVEELLRLNRLTKRARLSIGQAVVVRDTTPPTHTVRKGETLFGIAGEHRVAVEDLARINGLVSDRIAPGQVLLLQSCEQYARSGASQAQAAAGDPEVSSGSLPAAPPGVTERVIALARTMLDVPYRFGGSTIRGIDCSAFVQKVFGLLDIPLPRTAREQYEVGARIGRGELSIGDLVFFRTYAGFPSHVGIYVGDNSFIHASSVVRKVTIDSLDRPYYLKRFLGGRRLVATSQDETAAAVPAR